MATGNLNLLFLWIQQKKQAAVYGKHWHRQRLVFFSGAFSMVVVRTAIAMGREFVWKSNTGLAVCRWLTSAGQRRPAPAPAATSVNRLGPGWAGRCYCQWIQLTAARCPPTALPAWPWKGPGGWGQGREEENHFQQNKPALSISTL